MHVGADEVITASQDELLLKDGRVLKDTMSGLLECAFRIFKSKHQAVYDESIS